MKSLSQFFSRLIQRKTKVDEFLELLTISNSSFQKISREIEKSIFWGHEIINPEVPAEYQEESILTKKDFDKRFTISAGIIGIAILEYVLTENYSADLFENDLKKTQQVILPNILKLRADILKNPTPVQFEDDKELLLDNTATTEINFISMLTHKSHLIKSIIENGGEHRNIYYHFYQVLGQVLPDKSKIFFSPDHAKIIDKKIKEVVDLFKVGLGLSKIETIF